MLFSFHKLYFFSKDLHNYKISYVLYQISYLSYQISNEWYQISNFWSIIPDILFHGLSCSSCKIILVSFIAHSTMTMLVLFGQDICTIHLRQKQIVLWRNCYIYIRLLISAFAHFHINGVHLQICSFKVPWSPIGSIVRDFLIVVLVSCFIISCTMYMTRAPIDLLIFQFSEPLNSRGSSSWRKTMYCLCKWDINHAIQNIYNKQKI